MRKAIYIALGIWMMTATAHAQQVKTDNVVIKANTLYPKNPTKSAIHTVTQPIGFMHTPVHKGFRVAYVSRTSLSLDPMRRKTTFPAFMGMLTSGPRMTGSSCPVTADVHIYECPHPVSDKNIQPAVADNKLSNITDEDGGMNIDLTQKTSLTFGFGYGAGMNSYKDISMDMDNDDDDGLVNIGVQFGIK